MGIFNNRWIKNTTAALGLAGTLACGAAGCGVYHTTINNSDGKPAVSAWGFGINPTPGMSHSKGDTKTTVDAPDVFYNDGYWGYRRYHRWHRYGYGGGDIHHYIDK